MKIIFVLILVVVGVLPNAARAEMWYDKQLTPAQQQQVDQQTEPAPKPLDFQNVNSAASAGSEPTASADNHTTEPTDADAITLNPDAAAEQQTTESTTRAASSHAWWYIVLIFAIIVLVVFLLYRLRPQSDTQSSQS